MLQEGNIGATEWKWFKLVDPKFNNFIHLSSEDNNVFVSYYSLLCM